MRWISCLLALVFVPGVRVGAVEPPAAVVQTVAKSDARGRFWVQRTLIRQVFETVHQTRERPFFVIQNGKQVKQSRMETEPVTVARQIIESALQELNIDEVEFYDVSGKLVTPQAVTAKLKGETRVLLSMTGAFPPAELLSVFEQGTLVLVPDSSVPPAARNPVAAAPGPLEFALGLPSGPHPRLTLASLTKDGRIKLRNIFESSYDVIPRKQGRPDAAIEAPAGTIRVTDVQNRTRELDAGLVHLFTIDGKPLSPEAAAERLKSEVVVVESADGELPDEFYLRSLKKDALILVVPEAISPLEGGVIPSAPSGPQAPPAAPAPKPAAAPAAAPAPKPAPAAPKP